MQQTSYIILFLIFFFLHLNQGHFHHHRHHHPLLISCIIIDLTNHHQPLLIINLIVNLSKYQFTSFNLHDLLHNFSLNSFLNSFHQLHFFLPLFYVITYFFSFSIQHTMHFYQDQQFIHLKIFQLNLYFKLVLNHLSLFQIYLLFFLYHFQTIYLIKNCLIQILQLNHYLHSLQIVLLLLIEFHFTIHQTLDYFPKNYLLLLSPLSPKNVKLLILNFQMFLISYI